MHALPPYDPRLVEAALAMNDNALAVAEPLLRGLLRDDPFDVRAIRLFAELAARVGRVAEAERLLRRALDLAPGFTAARANLAQLLHRANRSDEALAELALVAPDEAAGDDPLPTGLATLQAAAHGKLGQFDAALALYAEVLERHPGAARIWLSQGHLLKTVGRQAEGIAAYRRALDLQPTLGEAWWSLANLKTVRFAKADLAAMAQALAVPGLSAEDRWHLDFALGKALADRGEPAAAFGHYARANALRRRHQPWQAERLGAEVDAAIALATPAWVARGRAAGHPARDPIFVLGLPRAGSTLVEQILASHSHVEGTSELPDIAQIARAIAGYPQALAALDDPALHALGAQYLARTRVQRQTARPLFIDKMPNNWLHVPLILAILPGATIIDARRHPLACGFSNFTQHYARGQGFAYDLADIGRYYRDYVRLMAHVDRVAPGRVHRVIHEALLDDTEAEVRALLAHCGLPFEAACLAFHTNRRAVRTASSEQVRRPINRDGTEAWVPFAPWLGPLRAALGPVLDAYPAVPEGL